MLSDLHGCYDKFIKLLDKIEFKDNDELYILGDVLDRGDKPLEILDYIMSHKNIILLKGNHEQMCIDFYENNDISWHFNGGQRTYYKILNRDSAYQENLRKFLKNLTYIKVIDKFILVHAGLQFSNDSDNLSLKDFVKTQKEDDCLWDRSNIGNERKYKDYTVICGHTPVQLIANNSDDVRIIKRYETIYIDCGCVFLNGKLACLRLDDMAEFYVS